MAGRVGTIGVQLTRAVRTAPAASANRSKAPVAQIANSVRATAAAAHKSASQFGNSLSRRASAGRGLGLTVSSALFSTSAMATELAPAKAPAGQEIATFAGGCFWGLELAYQRLPGVAKTSVGYTQGSVESPSYQAVCSGRTGHAEAVQVYYDPKEISYEQLLELFFDRVDPTTKDRQGNDSGSQYRSGIYYHNEEQKAAAEKAIAEVNEKLQSSTWRRVLGTKVVTELKAAADYWLAENYHQQYLQKGGQDASKGATDRIRCYG